MNNYPLKYAEIPHDKSIFENVSKWSKAVVWEKIWETFYTPNATTSGILTMCSFYQITADCQVLIIKILDDCHELRKLNIAKLSCFFR